MVSASTKPMDVQSALDDLQRRTLGAMERPLDRMIYLASLRDYNTGLYYHAGLADRFTDEVACEAIATCHRQAFQQLLGLSVPQLLSQLEGYMNATHSAAGEFLATWGKLEPYRVAVPVTIDPVAAELLFSSFQAAVSILEERQQGRREEPPAALPPL